MIDEVARRLRNPARLDAVERSGLLDRDHPAIQRLSRLAASVLDAPVALFSVVTDDRQVFPGQVGLAEPWATEAETPLSHSFCQYVVADERAFVVPDARADGRVHDNLAIEELGVESYLGVPVATPGGHVLGALCVIDDEPRDWSDDDLRTLEDLAAMAAAELALDELTHRLVAAPSEGAELVVLHELRTLVGAMAAGIKTLAHGAGLTVGVGGELAQVLERQAEELFALVGSLINGTTDEHGQVEPERVALAPLLGRVSAAFELAGTAVDVTVADGLAVMAHPGALRRCLLDLVDDAFRRRGDDARISLVAEARDERVAIVVGDEQSDAGGEDGPAPARAVAEVARTARLHAVGRLVDGMGGTIERADEGDVRTDVVIELTAAAS